MFGLRRRKALSESELRDQIISQTDECILKIKERWIYYNQMLKFKNEVQLSEIIESFSLPILEFVNLRYPLFATSPDQGTR
jgi:hypothetical protein